MSAAPAAIAGKFWKLTAGHPLDWPGGWCLWIVEGTYGGARAALQLSSPRWANDWFEFSYDTDPADDENVVTQNPMWIEAGVLRVVVTGATASTSLTHVVQRCG